MSRQYLREIPSGSSVSMVCLVRSKALRAARNGTLYIEMELADKSGSLPTRMWNATQEVFDSLEIDGFVEVSGRIETYRNQLQMVVNSINLAREADIDLADFLPCTEHDTGKMLKELRKIASSVKRPYLKSLLDAFFADDKFCEQLATAPAAVTYHHAVIGGLLEHTLSVAELAVQVAERYPKIDRDLLIAGSIFHDIGKIDELSYHRSFQYTDSGQLIGHIVLGLLQVEERAKRIDGFPGNLLDQLRHLMLSHHGEYDFGSPKLPMSVEAVALHHIDNLDAKINAFNQIIENDRDPSTAWTEWSRMFERRLYKGPSRESE